MKKLVSRLVRDRPEWHEDKVIQFSSTVLSAAL